MVGLAAMGRTGAAHANASRLCRPLSRGGGSARGERACVLRSGAAALPRVPTRFASTLEGRSICRRMAHAPQRARTGAPECLGISVMRPRVGLAMRTTGVLVLCPGGLEHGGGIGRQMGYFLDALPQGPDTPAYRVVDTRGPWFLGGARWRIPLSALYLAAAACRIAWAGMVGRPGLLHVNITGRGSTTRKLALTAIARAVALPYVLHIHDYDYAADVHARGGLMQRLVRGMFAAATQIITLGAEAERTLRVSLALSDAPILILPNAVPDPHPAPPAAAGVAAGPPRLVFLGHLSARKGVPELLEALASPALSALPWRATLAGGGPVDEVRARAATLGLGDRVAFPGWIDQRAASSLCAEADILVLPS